MQSPAENLSRPVVFASDRRQRHIIQIRHVFFGKTTAQEDPIFCFGENAGCINARNSIWRQVKN
jgi:hypothetical protein